VVFIKSNIQISNQVYRDAFGVSKPTATRHLDSLAKKGILQRIGTTGKGTYYILKKKGLIKGSKGSWHRLMIICGISANGIEMRSNK
jgi:ATP-dependent DNA helicase RecG